ncbi:MAG: hypothetical protein ACJZ14_07495 [Candidatus Neomarinimicrobiota bacterium]
MLIGYIIFLFIKKDPPEEVHPSTATNSSYLFFLIGLILIVSGGHLMVEHASNVARFIGISDWVIAVTIVAAGYFCPRVCNFHISCSKGKTWYCSRKFDWK